MDSVNPTTMVYCSCGIHHDIGPESRRIDFRIILVNSDKCWSHHFLPWMSALRQNLEFSNISVFWNVIQRIWLNIFAVFSDYLRNRSNVEILNLTGSENVLHDTWNLYNKIWHIDNLGALIKYNITGRFN